MSELSDNYKKILTEIDSKISNQEEKEFVKKKIMELSTLFLDAIDDLIKKTDTKITKIEEKQNEIENKIMQVDEAVDEIENNIYEDDEEDDYEFEIACPYCNSEFIAEISGKSEIECPKCHNIIELEWNGEDEDVCKGNCSNCGDCDDTSFLDDNQDINNNDDDM